MGHVITDAPGPYDPLIVTLNACDSSPGSSAIKAFTFSTSVTGFAPITTTECMVKFSAPLNSTFTATVRVMDAAGLFSTASATVIVRDYLIVALGDSYASGEGNPDVPGDALNLPSWESSKCDRSQYAPAAYAASWIEARDPKTSVTFVSRACAGATASDIAGQWSQVMATLTPPSGQTVRKVDAILLGIGGNDMMFVEAIKLCLLEQDCTKSGRISDLLGSTVQDYIDTAKTVLPSRLNDVFVTLRANASIVDRQTRILITEYPDPTRKSNSEYCTMENIYTPEAPHCLAAADACDGYTKLCGPDPIFPWKTKCVDIPVDPASRVAGCAVLETDVSCWNIKITKHEAEYISTQYIPVLNGIVRDAADRNMIEYVGGILEAGIPHGECTSAPWIHSYQSSIQSMGCEGQPNLLTALGVGNAVEVRYPGWKAATVCYSPGILHPNKPGAQNVARGILNRWDNGRAPVAALDSRDLTNPRVSGWAFDPLSPGDSLAVDVYLSGPRGEACLWNKRPTRAPDLSVTTNIMRPEVNEEYALTGAHGFEIDLSGYGPGRHSVCVWARGSNIDLMPANVQPGGTYYDVPLPSAAVRSVAVANPVIDVSKVGTHPLITPLPWLPQTVTWTSDVLVTAAIVSGFDPADLREVYRGSYSPTSLTQSGTVQSFVPGTYYARLKVRPWAPAGTPEYLLPETISNLVSWQAVAPKCPGFDVARWVDPLRGSSKTCDQTCNMNPSPSLPRYKWYYTSATTCCCYGAGSGESM